MVIFQNPNFVTETQSIVSWLSAATFNIIYSMFQCLPGAIYARLILRKNYVSIFQISEVTGTLSFVTETQDKFCEFKVLTLDSFII